jgi:hypothetical protein
VIERARLVELDAAAGEAFLAPTRWVSPPHPPLAESGYAVQEFLISGDARLFVDGATRPPRVSGTTGYTTRALVIRPTAERFSGVVHVELLNPSTGVDFPMFWPDAARPVMRRGDAYVGVTCKRVTTEALRRISPRYAELDIPHDGAVWDLIGAVALACRRSGPDRLLTGLAVPDRVLLTGWSQSGSFLRTYLAEGLADLHAGEAGRPIVDGYLIGVSSGGFGPMGYVPVDRDGEVSWDADLRPEGELRCLPIDDPRRVIRGAAAPVVQLLSEDEARHDFATQRPDSDVPGDQFRSYVIPGRGHESGLLDDRSWSLDRAAAGIPHATPPLRRHEATSFLLAAVLDQLVAWTGGAPPARIDPVPVVVPPGFRPDPAGLEFGGTQVLQDADGHALGGMRYLEIEVPVARAAPRADGPSMMRDWTEEPFDRDELVRRYGSPEGLRALARRTGEDLVRRRHLLAVDLDAAVDGLCRRWP